MCKQVPFGTTVPGKKNAAFVVITMKSTVYENYDDPNVDKNQQVNLAVMVHRWDGCQGFIGGMVDQGESLRDAAMREMMEEINLDIVSADQLEPLASHELDRLVVHAFHCDLGLRPTSFVRKLFADAVLAEHSIAEGVAIPVHLETYKWGKGLPRTLASNTLASAVKEELELVCDKLKIKRPANG